MAEAQLSEYELQLSDIQAMLDADPSDASLLKLKDDLLELIALTKSELELELEQQGQGHAAIAASVASPAPGVTSEEAGEGGRECGESAEDLHRSVADTVDGATTTTAANAAGLPEEIPAVAAAAPAAASQSPPKKKKKKTKIAEKFEVPDHLIPLDSDTDAERNRKRRTLKALKSKFREKQKSVETEMKQQSWQDFAKKKNKGKRSIFATEEGVNAKVGVISGSSGRNITEFGERKRHKH